MRLILACVRVFDCRSVLEATRGRWFVLSRYERGGLASHTVDDASWARWWRLKGRDQLTGLLWEKWDPIGWPKSETSRGYKPPRDEYESYIAARVLVHW